MKLYVGNIPHSVTEEELASKFNEIGETQSLRIITDRETGRSRGFGFVEMSDEAANKAIQELNDTEFMGRKLNVSEAQEMRPKNNFNRRRNY